MACVFAFAGSNNLITGKRKANVFPEPVADNSTVEGKSQNRRVSFVNAALRGKAIGGMPTDGGGKAAVNPCK